ncbi:unnamed protein product, partial [Mesorhabditis belari]|uniref:Homeobox domain-containing protein n=1 Tax=Mesorhabditis belari TaxID=2138241 RepID=A0AAF3FJD4_9BILA
MTRRGMLGQRRIAENPGPIASPPIYQSLHDHQLHHQQPYKRSAQEANLSDDESKKRRLRTNFTEDQSNMLEEAFQASHYPDQNSKKNMAQTLDIPEDRITVWFQNRRAKWRRKEMRDKEKNRYTGEFVSSVCLPHPQSSQMDFPPFGGGFEGQMELNGHPQHPDLPTSMLSHSIDGNLLGIDSNCSLPQPIPLNPVQGANPFHLYPPRGSEQLSSLSGDLSLPFPPSSLLTNPLSDHEFINSYCPQTNEQLTYTYFPPDI